MQGIRRACRPGLSNGSPEWPCRLVLESSGVLETPLGHSLGRGDLGGH